MERKAASHGKATPAAAAAYSNTVQAEYDDSICSMCGEDLDNNEEIAKTRCHACGERMYHKVCLDPWRIRHSPTDHKYKHWGYQCARGQGANPFKEQPCKIKIAATFHMPRWKRSKPAAAHPAPPAVPDAIPEQDEEEDEQEDAAPSEADSSYDDSSRGSDAAAAAPAVLPDDMKLRPLSKADDDLDAMYAVRKARAVHPAPPPAAAAAAAGCIPNPNAPGSWAEHYLETSAAKQEGEWQLVQGRPAPKQAERAAVVSKRPAAAKAKSKKGAGKLHAAATRRAAGAGKPAAALSKKATPAATPPRVTKDVEILAAATPGPAPATPASASILPTAPSSTAVPAAATASAVAVCLPATKTIRAAENMATDPLRICTLDASGSCRADGMSSSTMSGTQTAAAAPAAGTPSPAAAAKHVPDAVSASSLPALANPAGTWQAPETAAALLLPQKQLLSNAPAAKGFDPFGFNGIFGGKFQAPGGQATPASVSGTGAAIYVVPNGKAAEDMLDAPAAAQPVQKPAVCIPEWAAARWNIKTGGAAASEQRLESAPVCAGCGTTESLVDELMDLLLE